jgi:hypothetical protein
MLAAVPDLRPSLKAAGPEELADLLEAFDVPPYVPPSTTRPAARWSSAPP